MFATWEPAELKLDFPALPRRANFGSLNASPKHPENPTANARI